MLLSIKRFFIQKKDEKRNKHLIVLSLKIRQNKQQYHFRKPANKKSSPKQDSTQEKFAKGRQRKKATQKDHHKVLV